INRQLNPDGTNKEQSFWYLGFVLDAIFHYLLIEDRKLIPRDVWCRVEKSIEFISEMVLPNGSFPDYGDRDDGYIFRIETAYNESPFPGLLNTGAILFDRPDWYKNSFYANQRFKFWSSGIPEAELNRLDCSNQRMFTPKPVMQTYPYGGMTLMKWGKGRLLFRHAPLGLEPTFGHGHADALSILLSWGETPVLIDLGSGQYNKNQVIRNFFRSTIAHNTIEIAGSNQANILGPFLWDKSYKSLLNRTQKEPFLAEAYHKAYENNGGVVHARQIEWPEPERINITDSLSDSGGITCKGAFHLGACKTVKRKETLIEAIFNDFIFSITFPAHFIIEVYHGSKVPFMGWKSEIYGNWKPISSVLFSFNTDENSSHEIRFVISEY
ncbi:MAG: heparinase II/III family protein, partial [Candidatus Heimdallarchaeaceae archaeon]